MKGLKNGIFPIYYDNEDNDENDIRDNNGLIDYEKLKRLINTKERDINDELVGKIFLVQDLRVLPEKLKKSKNDAVKNKIQVGLINSGLRD